MNTDAATKVAQQKLKVLELAEILGNITAACRQQGISRTSLYEYKRRFEENGLEGLTDLPPIVKRHPFTTSARSTLHNIIEHMVITPLVDFGVLQAEYEPRKTVGREFRELSAFRITPFGRGLLEAINNAIKQKRP